MQTLKLLPVFLSSLFLLLRTTSAEAPLYTYCNISSGTYTRSDPYAQSLDELAPAFIERLKILPADLALVTTADNTDHMAFGLILCRTDLPQSTCDACVADGMPQLRRACPNQKEGIAWFDSCMVRYAPRNYYALVEDDFRVTLLNTALVSNPFAFNQKVGELLKRVSAEAYGNEKKLFGTEEADVVVDGKKERLYSLAQCTGDIRAKGCKRCLQDIVGSFPSCCDGRRGGRVLTATCHFRYELYRFY